MPKNYVPVGGKLGSGYSGVGSRPTTMFEKAKEHAKEYQCQIINLSNRKGMIEVFDRKEAIEPY